MLYIPFLPAAAGWLSQPLWYAAWAAVTEPSTSSEQGSEHNTLNGNR